jgi:hypothetical protein
MQKISEERATYQRLLKPTVRQFACPPLSLFLPFTILHVPSGCPYCLNIYRSRHRFYCPTCNGERVLAVLIRLLLCAQFLCIPALAAATTLVAVRTSTDIYVGADSRSVHMSPAGTLYHDDIKCKIGHVGNIFFAGFGPVRHPPTALSIELSLRYALRQGETVARTVRKFETLHADALAKTLRITKKWYPQIYNSFFFNSRVYVYLFAFEIEVPRFFVRTFTVQSPKDSVIVSTEECPLGCPIPMIDVIAPPDVTETMSPDLLKTLPPIQAITEVIETSIREDPYQRSAAPIDILHLNKDGARWVQKKKECGEIRSYINK